MVFKNDNNIEKIGKRIRKLQISMDIGVLRIVYQELEQARHIGASNFCKR